MRLLNCNSCCCTSCRLLSGTLDRPFSISTAICSPSASGCAAWLTVGWQKHPILTQYALATQAMRQHKSHDRILIALAIQHLICFASQPQWPCVHGHHQHEACTSPSGRTHSVAVCEQQHTCTCDDNCTAGICFSAPSSLLDHCGKGTSKLGSCPARQHGCLQYSTSRQRSSHDLLSQVGLAVCLLAWPCTQTVVLALTTACIRA